MISKEIWNQFSFWNCIIYKTPGCQKPNNGLSKDASSHIKIVIFNLTQRLHSVQFGFLCWLLSKSERQRRIPEQTNISYLERLLSLSPIKQTQGSSLKIFSPHLCLNQDQSRPRPLIIIIILNQLWCHHDDNSGTCHTQTPKYVNLNKKGPCPVLFGIWSDQTFPQKMLVKVVSWRVVSSQNWSLMDVAGSDINNRGITRQTHGPLSDNCHIWDQFSIQNTTVTQLSITKAPLENISNQNIFIFIEWIFMTSVLLIRYSFYDFPWILGQQWNRLYS